MKRERNFLVRKKIIERRKEIEEQIAKVKSMEEQNHAAKIKEERDQREKKKKEDDEIKKDKERKQHASIVLKREKVEELLASQDEVIARMVRKDLEGDDTAPDVVEEQIRETINKVKERREEKMKGLAKTVDHLERAKREEERPKTLALQKKMDEANKIYCEEQKKSVCGSAESCI